MHTLAEMQSRGLTLLEMLDIAREEATDARALESLCVEAASELRRRDAALEAAIESAIRREAFACSNALKALRFKHAAGGG